MDIVLRDYQEKILDELFHWWDKHTGNPCVVAPTGSGKSVLIAEFCKRVCSSVVDARVIVCSHQKELIEQDYTKLKDIWFWSDVGIYSAGIGRKELENQITFAGIQSIYRHTKEIGKVDLVLVDEAHTIQSKDSGMYRTFINGLLEINPLMKVIGFTATPYRMDCGMITDKPAIFDAPLIDVVSIKDLQEKGYLCKLTAKATGEHFDVSHVKITAGDYNKQQLLEAVDIPGKNEAVVNEVVKRAEGRKSWVIFCSGIAHAENIRHLLLERGVSTEMVTGQTPKEERERILSDFKVGKITAITNMGVLTTGFDAPNIDLIVLLRPTLSPGLYVQMCGRGLRISPKKENCLVLDFAENVKRHGPITNVQPPQKKSIKRKGPAPCKICPSCSEIIPIQSRTCYACGYKYPEPPRDEKKYLLSKLNINHPTAYVIEVGSWNWHKSTSKNGNEMLVVTYVAKNLMEEHTSVSEYLLLWHEFPNIQRQSLSRLNWLCAKAKVKVPNLTNIQDLIETIKVFGVKPQIVVAHRENRFLKVDRVLWEEDLKDVRKA